MIHVVLKPEEPKSEKAALHRSSNKALILGILSICVPFMSPGIGCLCMFPAQWIFPRSGSDALGVSMLGVLIGILATLLAGLILALRTLFIARGKPVGKAPWIVGTIGLVINGGLLLAYAISFGSSLAR